jgi:hypothetical protein
MGLALDPFTNWIYVPVGSCPSGWMFAYDKTTLQQTAVFDATPGAGGGGFWGSGAAPAIDDANGNIYVMNWLQRFVSAHGSHEVVCDGLLRARRQRIPGHE